ncbi:Neural adherens junction protein Plakophilin and related Armadillo repeat proteins [Plasmopara halstedii]|uniref:Neural adherens junction protein Plakophilin and related Armadillo repeat proteins n=1 Tax=Plasmopara halstedii TaxID=4781 RepID=A0A0P1AP45_PLAHL|nr:Neural adherens junction protein Plakophilin and related Armadillo repeat proteins [Plasmopara halstedii]CEG42838.1 Neural adherens junction protein Plakophilin and related Armadillo repeat proteins [Plasmopara halstedii]|eukprot:XP_024579207.1 Neural adherens junction protein Plakophilin and related Armadillo repeat proteins [Plasmopara halstedii]
MDACIARGGISHVLFQARASLNNPSRPITPHTSSRSLFHSDDNRPESHLSLSNALLEPQQMLPPSIFNLKLAHAPILLNDNAEDDATGIAMREVERDLEASLSLPSNDELQTSYDEIEHCIKDIHGLTSSREFVAAIGRLRELLENFLHLSFFLQVGIKTVKDASDVKLHIKLFNKLCTVLLDQWEINATCLLELAPSLLALYGIIPSDDDKFSNSARILKLSKMLFGFSRDSKNDNCFCNVRYVEAILSAISNTSNNHADEKNSTNTNDVIISSTKHQKFPLKLLIYMTGTIKNISDAQDKMVHLLATNRAIATLSETLLWRTDEEAEKKEVAQLLVQITGILRNLSVVRTYQKQFLESHIPLRLCRIIPVYIPHPELMVNISRILGKLTLHELPRAQINQDLMNVQNIMTLIDPHYNTWIKLANEHCTFTRFQELLFVRVFFILGNLCAGNDQNRSLIGTKNGITNILIVLQTYARHYLNDENTMKSTQPEDCRCDGQAKQAMEVLVKLVRVLANLAINVNVATELNGQDSIEILLDILKVSHQAGHEELMLNTVSCITNVSYYTTRQSSETSSTDCSFKYNFIESNRITIVQLLSQILLSRNVEAVVEAARAFGNLSRFQDVLPYMDQHKVLECLVVLLDHSSREVVCTVCGVLMNAALDISTREKLLAIRPLIDNDCVDIRSLLVEIIESANLHDIDMTLIASKVLYNLLLSRNHEPSCNNNAGNFASDARQTIQNILESTYTAQAPKKDERRRDSELDRDIIEPESWQELRLVLSRLLKIWI